MEREILEVSQEDARGIVYGDSKEYVIIEDEITHHSRWSVSHRAIVKRIKDDKYFKTYYSVGATESQDQQAYDYDEPTFNEVFKVEKQVTVTTYE